ncbi:MAG: hypothetical protein WCV91_04415 [Candidatus Margulisiibacteriota bacterium]
MKPLDSTKAIESIERVAILSYFEKLLVAKIHKITLFSIFPITAAANLSDPHSFVMIDDLDKFIGLDRGRSDN